MKNYNIIADGDYVCEHRSILKDLTIWGKMTSEERAFFKPCYKCKSYAEYATDKSANICPCDTCEHRKTEIQVDNRMITLRHKYF